MTSFMLCELKKIKLDNQSVLLEKYQDDFNKLILPCIDKLYKRIKNDITLNPFDMSYTSEITIYPGFNGPMNEIKISAFNKLVSHYDQKTEDIHINFSVVKKDHEYCSEKGFVFPVSLMCTVNLQEC